jgi:hypothetical protein
MIMTKESARINVNRLIAALVGGFAVFLVMSMAVVSPTNIRVAALQKQLDDSTYGAGRLLDEAKTQLAAKNYEGAAQALDALVQKHPLSPEAVEGRALTAQLAISQAKDDAAWALAVADLRGKWIAAETTRLRAESEKELPATVERNWTAAQDALRADWNAR